jgi:hypothetical protein
VRVDGTEITVGDFVGFAIFGFVLWVISGLVRLMGWEKPPADPPKKP